MSDTHSNDTPASLVAMSTKKIIYIIICGVVAGLATWALAALLDAYIYKALLCRGPAAQCHVSYQYAAATAMVIGSAIGLFGLVRLHVFRPLLIILVTLVALWGLLPLVQSVAGYVGAIICAVLYGLSFGVFGWLSRIRRFYIAAIVMIVLAVVVRLVLYR